MMGVTNYITVNELIVGEEFLGGGRTDYAVDALGSVTGTLVGGVLQNTYAYKPFGAQLAKIGGGNDPNFLWVGSSGYWPTPRTWCEFYVRARHYSHAFCRWSTHDPLWP